jgi:hypothetical protein
MNPIMTMIMKPIMMTTIPSTITAIDDEENENKPNGPAREASASLVELKMKMKMNQ